MHFLILSETIKANWSHLVIKEMPQNSIVTDIARFKYAQSFQESIEKCFISLKVSFCYRG